MVQRLVFQLSEKQIVRIIEAVQPTEAKFIVETVEKVDHTRRKEPFVKADSRCSSVRACWELALRYVLEDRGSYFNTKEFAKSMLFGIADHFNQETHPTRTAVLQSHPAFTESRFALGHLVAHIG